MNCGLINRTLVVRLVLMMAIVGGAIVAFPQLELGNTPNTATRTAFKQGMSVQLNAE